MKLEYYAINTEEDLYKTLALIKKNNKFKDLYEIGKKSRLFGELVVCTFINIVKNNRIRVYGPEEIINKMIKKMKK